MAFQPIGPGKIVYEEKVEVRKSKRIFTITTKEGHSLQVVETRRGLSPVTVPTDPDIRDELNHQLALLWAKYNKKSNAR